MAVEKVKLTSQTAWETQKKINENFAELEERIDDIVIPTVPTKTSDLTNDGDGTSPFATEDYVDQNGGKIDSISVNGTPQTIDANKNVNITVPTKTSDITNDSGFIDNTVNNLVNYYTKSETYTKTEVNTIVLGIETVKIEIVSSLPLADNTTYFNNSKTIYMVAISGGSGNDYYNEYIAIRSGSAGSYTYSWELIGNTQVDLTNYVQKSRTIAGITLEYDITAAALRTALNVEDGAEANVQADWNQTNTNADDYIKNKPTIPTDTGATSVEVTGAGNVVNGASYDSTTRKITLTKGFTAQRAIREFPFTAVDSGWSSTADADGFYTLTLGKTGTPMDVYKLENSTYQKVMAGLDYDDFYIYIKTDTKFAGYVSVR